MGPLAAQIFRSRSTAEWIDLGNRANTPIAPVNTPKTLADDPQFQDRFPWLPHETHGADMLPSPLKLVGGSLPDPGRAPETGQHTEEVLRDVAGYDEARIAALREKGVFG